MKVYLAWVNWGSYEDHDCDIQKVFLDKSKAEAWLEFSRAHPEPDPVDHGDVCGYSIEEKDVEE